MRIRHYLAISLLCMASVACGGGETPPDNPLPAATPVAARTERKSIEFTGGLSDAEQAAHQKALESPLFQPREMPDFEAQWERDKARNERVAKALAPILNWNPGDPLPSEEVIAVAEDINFDKLDVYSVTNEEVAEKIADLRSARKIADFNLDETYRLLKREARFAVKQVADDFLAALRARDAEALRQLIDWEQYHAYLTFNGQDTMIQNNFPKPGATKPEYYGPFSHILKHKIEPKLDSDGQPVLDRDGQPENVYRIASHELRSIENMQTEGLAYLIKMYGTERVAAIQDIDKDSGEIRIKGTPDIEGAPEGGPKSEYFYADVNFTNGRGAHYEIGNEDLRVIIGGRWGGNRAKVVAIYDRTTKQWLTRIRDQEYNRKMDEEAGGDGFR